MSKPIPNIDVTRLAAALIGSSISLVAAMYRLDMDYDPDEMAGLLVTYCFRDEKGVWRPTPESC